MSASSRIAGPSKPTVHPSRLAKFNDNHFQPQFGVSPYPTSASTSTTNEPQPPVDSPVDSGPNSIPLRPTIKKRRKPVWTLPLKPLSKTAKAKKKAEDRKRAKFYEGAFRTGTELEAERERAKSRPKKKKTSGAARTRAHNQEVKRQKIERLRQQEIERQQEPDITENREGEADQDHAADETSTVEQPAAQDQNTERAKKKKKKDKGKSVEKTKKKKSKGAETEIAVDSERKDKKKKKVKSKAIISSEPEFNSDDEIEMNENLAPLATGSSVQNAITLRSSPDPEQPVSAITADEEEERLEYGPRPSRANDDIDHLADSAGTTNGIALNDAAPQQPRADSSLPRVYSVQYPVGGETYDNDGDGIFVNVESEDSLNIWIDTSLRDRISLIRKIENEGGQISADHTDEATQLLIIHPESTYLFDMYCYPEWLKPRDLEKYRLDQEETGIRDEAWQKKVILKAWWVEDCVKAGKYLGQEDNWGGCRAGGPPSNINIRIAKAEDEENGGDEAIEENGSEELETQQEEDLQPATYGSDEMEIDGEDQDQPQAGDVDHTIIAGHVNDTAENTVEDPINIDEDELIDSSRQSLAPNTEVLPEPFTPANLEQPTEPALGETSVQPQEVGTLMASDDCANSDPTEMAPSAISLQDNEAGPSNYMQAAEENELMDQEVEEEEEKPQDPKTLFAGLKFWVDTTCHDRISLIKRIRAAGAELVTSYAESTHVLIHEYKHSQWHSIVESLTKEGIWFMKISWVIKSLDQCRRLPEDGYIVPYGNPSGSDPDEKPIIPTQTQAGDKAFHHGGVNMPSGDLENIFTREKIHLDAGGTVKSLAAFLASKYGCYTEDRWAKLYYMWVRKEGRFAYLAPKIKSSPVKPQVTATQPTPGRASPNPAQMPTDQLVNLITKELPNRGSMNLTEFGAYMNRKYQVYPSITWSSLLSQFFSKKGRFKHLQQDQSKSSTTTPPVPKPNVELPQNSAVARKEFTVEELDQIFRDPSLTENGTRSFIKVGRDLAAKYGTYHSSTWSVMHSEWTRNTGRFKNFASKNTVPTIRRGSTTSASTKPTSASPTKSSAPSLTDEPEDGSPESLDAEKMARIFKSREEGFTKRNLTSIEIGLILKTEVGIYARATWRLQWTHWWQKRGKFVNIHPSLQSTIAAKAYADEELPFKGVKPSSSNSGTGTPRTSDSVSHLDTSPSKRPKPTPKAAKYTIAEEMQMAEYLSQVSFSHPRSIGTWIQYAALHPERSAAAYAQHYSSFQFRIDSYRTKTTKTKDPGPDLVDIDIDIDHLVAEPNQPPSGSQSRPVEIDDDNDEDEEDEDFEAPVLVIDDDNNDKDYVDVISIEDD